MYCRLGLGILFITSFANAFADNNTTTTVPNVVVSAHKNKPTNVNIDKETTTTITRQAIEHEGVANVTSALNGKSGLAVSDLYGDGSDVILSFRGFGDNAGTNSVLLLNGQPIIYPDLGDMIWNAFLPENISKIQLIPGSAGVLYGDQAVGGVINFILEPPHAAEHYFTLQLGSYDYRHISAIIGDAFLSGWSYRLSTGLTDTNNYRVHNARQADNLTAQINYQHNDTEINLLYQHRYDNLLYPGALTAAQVAQNPQQSDDTTDYSERNTDDLQFTVKKLLTENWQFYNALLIENMIGDGVLTVPFTEARHLIVLTPELNGVINVGQTSINATLGSNFSNAKYQFISDYYNSAVTQDTKALFSLFTVPLPNNFSLKFGGRVADADNSGQSLSAPIASHNDAAISHVELNWQKNSLVDFFVRRAGSYRFPKAEENALSLNQQPLATQEGVSYETGMNLHNALWQMNLLAYQLDLNNEILFIPDVTQQTFGYNENLPPTRRNGLLINSGYLITTNWQIEGSYNWVNGRFSSGIYAGNQIPWVARNSATLSSRWNLAENWQFFLEGLYFGSRFPGSDIANLAVKLPGYRIYNASVSYEKNYYRLAFRINNLANQRYNAYATAVYGGNDSVTTYFYPAPGRTFWLTLGVDA